MQLNKLALILTQQQSEELQSYLVEKAVPQAGSVGKTYLFLTKIEFDEDEESFTVHYKKALERNPSILRKDSGSNENEEKKYGLKDGNIKLNKKIQHPSRLAQATYQRI